MRNPITVAAAQPLTVSGDVAGNAERHAALVSAATADVVVFPELSLTGYELDAPPVSPEDPRLRPIVDACSATGSTALAGAPVVAPSGGRNIAVLAFDGGGARVAYRKMWLGGAELDRFSAGEAPSVFELGGWRLGLAVCKDTGVAEHAEATAALGCDVYVAGALETVDDAGVQPARARSVARRHGLWVAVASFAGSTGGGYEHAAGGSGIWRPDGSEAARVGAEVGAIARAAITDDAAVPD